MLVDFEKYNDAVDGAWLNKKGTIVAVKWNVAIAESKKTEIIKSVSAAHNVEPNRIIYTEITNTLKPFQIKMNGTKAKKLIS